MLAELLAVLSDKGKVSGNHWYQVGPAHRLLCYTEEVEFVLQHNAG